MGIFSIFVISTVHYQ
ncbi:TPA: 23S rRNA methylase leader peptide ErmCL, partial [Staphylococcus aureus]|nr:23S rRNA methylase leader peptide ErmCL [Staphylococcus aureus]HDD2650082.1 23S rRNA methylase leader peptide ErmCL [Staphylococcus aureus]